MDQGISIFPTNEELFVAARNGLLISLSTYTGTSTGDNLDTNFVTNEHWYFGPNGHPDLRAPVYAARGDVRDFLDNGARAFYGASSWVDNGAAGDGVQKLVNGLDNSFFVRCLNPDGDGVLDECNPFLGLGPPAPLGNQLTTELTSWAKSGNFACVLNRGSDCKHLLPATDQRADIDIYVVYYFYFDQNRANWCIGMHVRIDWESAGQMYYEPRILTGVCRSVDDDKVVLYQSSMRDEMVKAVDSVAPKIEACFARECGLDTKVSDN